ncbi:MAG: hypothetical protein ACOX35_04130 [Bacillota bacterium]|nr:hypothetical protein [Candidatus Fermentithermobacillaceae bacterium]
MSTDPKIWLAAIAIIAIYSYLFKENPLYRFAEHLYVGLSAGYSLAMAWVNIKAKAVTPISQGSVWLIIPCLLGLCLYIGLAPKHAWVKRYPTSFLVGLGTGVAMTGIISSRILSQIRATMIPLNSLNNIILVVGVLATVIYFLLSVTSRVRAVGSIGRVGRFTMMISFGVVFATSIFDNFALLIGTFKTILQCVGIYR